jgi:hypothetical protein
MIYTHIACYFKCYEYSEYSILLRCLLYVFPKVLYVQNRLKAILLLCREGSVPVPQEQPPAPGEPSVPLPEINRLPGTHVEVERSPDVPRESRIPGPVTALEDKQPHLAIPTTTPPPPPPSRIRTVSVSR